MSHPVMDKQTLEAQAAYDEAVNQEASPVVVLAGAYLDHGFHEDGFKSGIKVDVFL